MDRNNPKQKLNTFNRTTLAVDLDAVSPTSNEGRIPKLHYTTLQGGGKNDFYRHRTIFISKKIFITKIP